MGKAILIIVLGVSSIVSFLAINLNTNSSRNLDTTLDFYEETKARLIANSGVEIYLEKLRRDKSLTGSFPDNSLMGGTYDINIYGADTLLNIISTSTFKNKSHRTHVTARRNPIVIPPINSSIYVSSNNLSVKLNGNIDISGHDHNMDGSIGSNPSLPGIGVDDPSDSAFVVDNIKPKISHAISGEGGPPSVRTISDTTDWLSLTENYIFAADTTILSGIYSTGTFGTQSHPKITYVNGDVDFAGIAYGYGIMVVNGNLSMSGCFIFKGIIIAYGQSTIETKTIGSAGVYGAAIFVGENVDIWATGSAKFYYSYSAIQNAKSNLKSSRFEILSWWE